MHFLPVPRLQPGAPSGGEAVPLSPKFTWRFQLSELIAVCWQLLDTKVYNFHFFRQVT